MAKAKKPQFGGLPPMYNFIINPYPDQRLWRCPLCERKTGQRKLPLLIHVEPNYLVALNYTHRYCRHCDLLIAHKHEIEDYLTQMFRDQTPEVIGNDYLIIGTVEKKVWREGLKKPRMPGEIIPHTHDFKTVYQELRVTQGGWFAEDQEPPIMEPPPSQYWVK